MCNSVISNINEDNKSYNVEYDINERLRFLQNKYKDYNFKINRLNNKLITCKLNYADKYSPCCINFYCKTQPSFCIEGETKKTHCSPCADIISKKKI